MIIGLVLIPICRCITEVSDYAMYVYFYVISLSASQLFLCDLRGKELLLKYSLGNILQTLMIAILNITFLLVFKMETGGYLLAYIIANFIVAIYAIIAGKGYKAFSFHNIDRCKLKEMIRYSIVLIPNTFMWWIMNSSDRVMVTYMIGAAANGIYAVSYKLPTLVSTLTGIFNQAWSYSAIREEGTSDETEYNNKMFKTLSAIAFMMGIGLLLLTKPFLGVYVADSYYDAWKYTPFLIIGCVYLTLGTFMATSYTVHSFHMPLFFLAAGWVYKEKTVLADIKRRIQTIVIPYFSFGFLVLIYWQLMERRFRDSDMSFMDSLFGLFSGCYDNLEFNIHLWFLPCFFVTVILFNILVNLGGRRMAYLVSALMSLAFIVVPMHGLIWGIDRVFKYIGFYAVGVFIAGKSVKAVKKKVKAGIVAIVLLALSFSLSCYHLTMGIMWFVTAMIGVAAVILISQLINENRILQYFGRISLIILCIHGPVYRIVVKIVSILLNLGTDAVRENFLLAMVVVVITMAICSTAYEVVVRLAPWMVGKKKVKEN